MTYNSNCDNMNGGFFRSTERATKYTHNNRVVFKAPVLGYPPHVVADCGPQVWEFCVMSVKDGKPCKKCRTSGWYNNGRCKECGRERHRQWAQENPDKQTEATRRWRQSNPDKVAEYYRRWAQSNPDKVNANTSRWQRANPENRAARLHRRRTRETEAGGSYTAAEFKEMCNHYGNKCLRCGRDDVKLTFDHVLPVSMGGTSDISNGQPLCGKCNSAKNNRHIDYRPDAGLLRWLQCKLFG